MGSFTHRLQETIVKESLFSRKDRLLVAFSGGSDSVSLVHALINLGFKNLHLIYFDHGLRSQKERDADKQFVANFCKSLNVPYRIIKLPISFIARTYNYSVEAAGHKARYYFLEVLAKRYQADAVLLAHHYDDLIETALLQVDRGSVFHLGMPLKYYIGKQLFVRPLLKHSKQSILDYISEKNLCYAKDKTNDELVFKRNKFRHSILPLLSSLSPAFSRHLTILLQRVQSSYETAEFKEILNSCKFYENRMYFQCVFSDSARESHFYLSSVIYNFFKFCFQQDQGRLKQRLCASLEFNMTQLDSISNAVLAGKSGEIIQLAKGVGVFCYDKNLFIKNSKVQLDSKKTLCCGDALLWNSKKILFDLCKDRPLSYNSSVNECYICLPKPLLSIDFVDLSDTWFLKPNSSSMNVSEALSKKGIYAFFRSFSMVFKYGNDVAWIPDLGVDSRFWISDSSQDIYKLTIVNDGE